MRELPIVGRSFVAIAMIAFGIQHLVYQNFVTRVFPPFPAWIPAHPIIACVLGVVLIVAGAAILVGKEARTAALVLGGVIFVAFVALHLPLVLASPSDASIWTKAGKGLALTGACLLVAGSLPVESAARTGFRATIARALGPFIPFGRFFLAAFLVLAGSLHFVYAGFVATLVPAWIPGALYWTYFTGSALVAGGIGIVVPWTTRLAASLTAVMIFLWVVLLHIPRALADVHDSNETTAAFEALAMTGAAILIASAVRSPQSAAR